MNNISTIFGNIKYRSLCKFCKHDKEWHAAFFWCSFIVLCTIYVFMSNLKIPSQCHNQEVLKEVEVRRKQ